MQSEASKPKFFLYKLRRFFLMDPSLKPKKAKFYEDDLQDSKNLYYYPTDTMIEQQRNHIGLAEGMIQIWESFSKNDNELLTINSQNLVHIYAKFEESLWFCIIIKTFDPILTYSTVKNDYALGKEGLTNQTISIDYDCCKNISQNFYNIISFFKGPLRQYINEGELDPTIKTFLNDIIPLLNSSSDYLDLLKHCVRNMVYAPVDKKTFLSNFYLINLLKEKDPGIKEIFIKYSGLFIITDSKLYTKDLLYSILTDQFKLINQEGISLNNFPKKSVIHDVAGFDSENPIPFSIFKHKSNDKMVIIEGYKFCIGLIYDLNAKCLLKTDQDLDEVVEKNLAELGNVNSKALNKVSVESQQSSYIVYNFDNFALKISQDFSLLSLTDKETYVLAIQLFMKLIHQRTIQKIILRTSTSWIVSHCANNRLFVIVFTAANINDLKLIYREKIKFLSTYFPTLYLE